MTQTSIQDDLAAVLTSYLCSGSARRLCQSNGVDPLETMSDLFLYLVPTVATARNLQAWVPFCGRRYLCELLGSWRESKRRSDSLDALMEAGLSVPDPHSNAEENQEALAQRQRKLDLLQQELKRLPRMEREALLAKAKCHPEKLSCRKLAQRYNVSVTTITKWAAKARESLRARLEGQL